MALFIDTANIYRCLRSKFGPEARLSYEDFLDHVEGICGEQEVKIAYVAIPNAKARGFITFLESLDFTVQSKEPREVEVNTHCPTCRDETRQTWFNTDWAVELTLDALSHASKDSPIIICSSDYRLEPLIQDLVPKSGLVVCWGVGVPTRFKCQVKEIAEEFVLDGNPHPA